MAVRLRGAVEAQHVFFRKTLDVGGLLAECARSSPQLLSRHDGRSGRLAVARLRSGRGLLGRLPGCVRRRAPRPHRGAKAAFVGIARRTGPVRGSFGQIAGRRENHTAASKKSFPTMPTPSSWSSTESSTCCRRKRPSWSTWPRVPRTPIPAETQRFLKALDQVYKQSAKLSFKERLAVLLKIDPERVGIVYRDEKTKEVVERRKGKITEYKEMLARYDGRASAGSAGVRDAASRRAVGGDSEASGRAGEPRPRRSTPISSRRRASCSPPQQLARGPVPEPWTPQRRIDRFDDRRPDRARLPVDDRPVVPRFGDRGRGTVAFRFTWPCLPGRASKTWPRRPARSTASSSIRT